jgi:DNA-binding NarL/FixJ family response regulator
VDHVRVNHSGMTTVHTDDSPYSLPWSAVSRAVLATLNEGLKDEVAARRVAVSLRTYRRRVADLMDYFGVETRFELGVRVAEEGILDSRAVYRDTCTPPVFSPTRGWVDGLR